MKIDGYIIVQPMFPWDKQPYHPHEHTFAKTAGAAWRIFIGPNVKFIDQSRAIQFWFDRGYRVKKATLEVFDEG